MLGKGCGHHASASELSLELFGERGGASRGRALPVFNSFFHTPANHKEQEVYPPLTLSLPDTR